MRNPISWALDLAWDWFANQILPDPVLDYWDSDDLES